MGSVSSTRQHWSKWSGTAAESAAAAPVIFSNNGCGLFDGVNDYVTMGNVLDTDGTQAITVAAWTKSPGLTINTSAVILSKISIAGGGYTFGFYNNAGTIRANMYITHDFVTDYLGVAKDGIFTNNVWQHWVWTYDGSKTAAGCKIYLLGTNVSGLTVDQDSLTGTVSNSSDFNLGSRDNNGVFTQYKGRMAQVAIWMGTALNQTEVTELYNGGTVLNLSLHSRWTSLSSWYQFATDVIPADAYDGTLYDRKGTKNGSVMNAASTLMDSDHP